MKKELQNKLYKKYPLLFKQRNLPINQTAMCWGIATGNGWFNLIKATCEKLQSLITNGIIPQIEFTQIKEKFGGLRIYFTPCYDEVEKVIEEAEELSYKICEDCGSIENVSQTKEGWIATLCKECKDKVK